MSFGLALQITFIKQLQYLSTCNTLYINVDYISMEKVIMNIALISAGGKGQRMNKDVPKQFLTVDGKPIIIYTLETFEKHPEIDAIYVICISGWEKTLEAYAKQFKITKLKSIVEGGETGFLSIKNGVYAVAKDYKPTDLVLVHDAIRPMLSGEIISANIATCKKMGNAVTAIPAVEVMLFSDDGKISSNKSVDRNKLARTQTPQTFKIADFVDAYKMAEEKGITDSIAPCSLMTDLGRTVYFCDGSEKNLKLTTIDDIDIFYALLNCKKSGTVK